MEGSNGVCDDWSKTISDMFDKSVANAPPPKGATTEELIKFMERIIAQRDNK